MDTHFVCSRPNGALISWRTSPGEYLIWTVIQLSDRCEDFPLIVHRASEKCSRIWTFIKSLQSAVKTRGTTAAVPPAVIFLLVCVHQVVKNDLLRPAADIIHPSHPGHGVRCFQRLGHALPLCHLFDEALHRSLQAVSISKRCLGSSPERDNCPQMTGRCSFRYLMCIRPYLPMWYSVLSGRVISG